MRSADPVIDPMSSDPSTMSTGKPGADGVAQGGVGDGDGRQPGHEEGHEPEAVGDDRAGVLAQAVTRPASPDRRRGAL